MKEKRTAHNKLTQEQVIQQFIAVHGDAFDYSKVEYKGVNTPVEVYCKKHNFTFTPTPKNHKNGAKCKYCGREAQIEKAKKDLNVFISELYNIYGDNYDYSKINYVNAKTDVEIICKKHGSFMTNPSALLNGHGCKNCRVYGGFKRYDTKSNNKDIFIQEALKIHEDQDDYSVTEVISYKDKVNIRCKKHDYIYEKDIQTYLAGYRCPKCSAENYSKIRRKPTEQFIEEAKLVHGNNCDYSDTVYKGCREKVLIKCNIHNEYFEVFPKNHMIGGRCRKCLSENISNSLIGKEGTCGYMRSWYIKQADGREAYVYLILCQNKEEEFYKIGKTFLDISKRFTKGNLPYNFKKIHSIHGEAGYIYDLENELHRKYKEYKYRPFEWFAGHTECYTTNLPTEEIISYTCQKE